MLITKQQIFLYELCTPNQAALRSKSWSLFGGKMYGHTRTGGKKRSFHFRKQLLWQIRSAQLFCLNSCQLSPQQFATRSVGHFEGCSPDVLSCWHCLRPRDQLLVIATLGWPVAKTWPSVSLLMLLMDSVILTCPFQLRIFYDAMSLRHWALLEEVPCMKLQCHPTLFRGQSLSPVVLSFASVFEWPLECDMQKQQGMGS